MSANLLKQENLFYMQNQLAKLFDDSPAMPNETYKSSWLSRNRLISPDRIEPGRSRIRVSPLSTENMRLGHNEIGHYEKTFLRQLKLQSNSFVPFKSGTGSGKSSFCLCLDNYINLSFSRDQARQSLSGLAQLSVYVDIDPRNASSDDPLRPPYRDEMEITGISPQNSPKSYSRFVKIQLVDKLQSFFSKETDYYQFIHKTFSKEYTGNTPVF